MLGHRGSAAPPSTTIEEAPGGRRRWPAVVAAAVVALAAGARVACQPSLRSAMGAAGRGLRKAGLPEGGESN
jgi:hypothetical protein